MFATAAGYNVRYVWLAITGVIVFSLITGRLYTHHGSIFTSACADSSYVTYNCSHVIPLDRPVAVAPQENGWTFSAQRDANDYGLTDDQCESAFPGLFTEIEKQVSARRDKPITEKQLTGGGPRGMLDASLRCMIYDQQLYVIDTFKSDIRRSRQFSSLLAMTRAIVSSREKVPNIEFVISIEDFTTDEKSPMWAYDRKHDQTSTWLMPDFGYFAWPEPGVGTYPEVRKKMEDVESAQPNFSDKNAKLFWRGAINPNVAQELRQDFIDQAQGQPWADVEVLNWKATTAKEKHRVNIEDHCNYQYLMNTEGRAWSGRLKYIQNCRSVIVSHKLEWIVPHAYLMVPEGEHQNFVQVERNFSDLRSKMEHLVAHPEEAKRIADNSARVFRDRYLTPAAEACYWRKLFKGWSEVSFEPRFYKGKGPNRKWRGVPFDSYVLMGGRLHWDPA